MNIFYDENMPLAQAFFNDLGKLTAFSGRDISAQQLADADVLLVRSITQVNHTLLKDNQDLKFVGTATIGTDHVDQDYLASRGVPFHSAPGCNAVSVAEYVISALVNLSERYLFNINQKTVGIVGAGNTGTRLSEKLAALGVEHYLCDPLLEESGKDSRHFVSLEQVLDCDIISLHVPKTLTGEYKTFHLLDEDKLSSLSDEQILINACRGEVIDNQALLKLKKQGHGLTLVLDVWEGEPNILMPLLEHVDIATAHIAGYSLEGKARGTEMLYRALCQKEHIVPEKSLESCLPSPEITSVEINANYGQNLLSRLVKMVYDIKRDDGIFRQQINEHGFDYIRKHYPVRREFSSLIINNPNLCETGPLDRLGFVVLPR